MTLQTSGAISLPQVQSEFGGASPISLSEYYRGGAYVPATRTVTNYSSWVYSGIANNSLISYSGKYCWGWGTQYSSYWGDRPIIGIYWNYTQIFYQRDNTGTATKWNITSYTKSGWTYYRGIQRTTSNIGDLKWHEMRRSDGSTTTTNINTNIPTSGAISLNNMYGGTNT